MRNRCTAASFAALFAASLLTVGSAAAQHANVRTARTLDTSQPSARRIQRRPHWPYRRSARRRSPLSSSAMTR